MAEQNTLTQLLEALFADPKVPLDARLKRAGFQQADVEALCAAPGTESAIGRAIYCRLLLPVLPTVVRRLADQAAQGDMKAQALILQLLGDKSPLKEQGASDLSHVSDAAFAAYARNLMSQLGKIAGA